MTDRDEWGDPNESSEASAGDDRAAEPELYYGNVNEFFRDYLRFQYARRIGPNTGFRWCADWWRYGEAVSRLTALWRAWEHLRLDPATGASVWWRDHADHHMPALMSGEGVFRHSQESTGAGEPLPHVEPPASLFPDERTTGLV